MTKPTVLLVDDRRENLSVLVDALDRAGFRVLVAEHGAAGVEQARRALPDVIVLDVVMPVMDGYTACRALKADATTRDIPVLFMSARHETIDRVRGFAAGGIDHVTKPFRAEEVLARVTVHARLRRQTLLLQEVERALREGKAQGALPAVVDDVLHKIAAARAEPIRP